jgi:hypothetical protein
MDIKSVNGKIHIVNKGYSRIVSQAFGLGHDEEVTLDTRRTPERVLNDLQYFFDGGYIDVEVVEDNKVDGKIANTENIKTVNGKEHTVFKPSDKAINVQEIDTSGKSVQVGFGKIDAVELLEKHWKTLEKEVAKINNIDSLKLVLATAVELDMQGNKKYEIVKERIDELI